MYERLFLVLVLAGSAAFTGCAKENAAGDDGGDADSDSDADTDADTDVDTDVDTDADTDTDTDTAAECDQDSDGYLALTCEGDDCNDEDDTIHPGAEELQGWVVEDADPVGVSGGWPALAIGPDGSLHISYRAGTSDLLYATNADGDWETEAVDEREFTGFHSAIAVDSIGVVHILYLENAKPAVLRYAKQTDAGWEAVDVVEIGSPDEIFGISLTVDAAGILHTAFHDNLEQDLVYGRNSGGEWDLTTVDSNGNTGGYPAIVVGADATRHIVYHLESREDGGVQSLRYAVNAGEGWVQSTPNVEPGVGATVALDADGFLHIGAAGGFSLRYVTNVSGKWETEPVDVGAGFASFPTLAASPDGVVHLFYSLEIPDEGYAVRLRYARIVDGAEIQPESLGEDVGVRMPSVVIDAAGIPHVAYEATGALRHGTLDNVDQDCDGSP